MNFPPRLALVSVAPVIGFSIKVRFSNWAARVEGIPDPSIYILTDQVHFSSVAAAHTQEIPFQYL